MNRVKNEKINVNICCDDTTMSVNTSDPWMPNLIPTPPLSLSPSLSPSPSPSPEYEVLPQGSCDYTYNMEEEPLGKGSYAEVYLGESINGTAAIKVFRKLEYVAGEYTAHQHIEDLGGHRNVVRFISKQYRHNIPEFVFELIEGCDMFSWLYAKKNPNHNMDGYLLDFMTQFMSGLDFLHTNYIAHGDIKPENIMLSRRHGEFVVKLIDFGFAKIGDHEGVYTDVCCGSLDYASPQTLKLKVPHTKSGQINMIASDMWSAGVVTHIAYTGVIPFRRRELTDALHQRKFPRIVVKDDAHNGLYKNITMSLLRICEIDRASARHVLEILRSSS